MTIPLLGAAPTITDNEFGIEPFELTCDRRTAAGVHVGRRDVDAQLLRFDHPTSRKQDSSPVWARTAVRSDRSGPVPDHTGRLSLLILLRHMRRNYQQLQLDWDGTRLAVALSYDEGVLTQHWRPLNHTQEQLWAAWAARGGRWFQRMASTIVEEPAPVFEVAMTLAMHVWHLGLPGEFDAAVFAPALKQVKAAWPAGGLDPHAFAQLAELWNGTPEELLYAAVAVTTSFPTRSYVPAAP